MKSNRLLRYFLKRIVLMVLTFLVICTICFVLIRLLPLPAIKEQGRDAALLLARREAMGYGLPIPVQYLRYWRHVMCLDFGLGEQMYVGQEVAAVLADKIPSTVTVNFYAMLLSVPLGLLLGIYAALRKNRWQDHVISTGVMVFISVPSYVYAFLIQYFLCYATGLFPLTVADRATAPLLSVRMFRSMFPAVLSLAVGTVAALTRFTRAELADALNGAYMPFAKAKGLTRAKCVRTHALKNAMVPILPMILGEFVGVLSGSLIIEGIFSIPGVGNLYTAAINVRDYNFFMALTFFYTLIGLLSSLAVDLSYGVIDPRIRMGER